ncbi:hypothetical protein KUTeg_018136 [Tegillarca granosa]|uniref:Uncharacterized protein n=1 Tax=Tegillarca granosa TaxID=220873 RepID=A0ABQ9EGZ7_TEGGR|nr:hypothetical protein KUTeg_018136 [Tegillarca granosa]
MDNVSVEDIGRLYRRGSDVDLQAIFGGHISGKRSQNGKINPVFLDGMLQSSEKGDNSLNSKNGIITGRSSNGIDTNLYKNISNSDSKRDLNMASTEIVNGNSQQELRQDSLKVTTNEDVCVGDIVIENGLKNPSFDSEEESGLYSVMKTVKNSKANTSDYEIQKFGETDNKKDIGINGELIVSNVTVVNHMDNTVVNISDQISSNQSDWPEIDDLVLSEVDHNQNKKTPSVVEKSKDLASTSGLKGENHVFIVSDKSGEVLLNQGVGSSSVEQIKNEKNSPINTNSKHSQEKESGEVLHHSEPKVHKSILVHTCSTEEHEHEHRKANGTVTEQKSVKFSKDTVDNEEKPKKYKKEKIFISNIYQGRITNNATVAKSNPAFLDDDGLERSLTDDEKAARYSFRKIRTTEGQCVFVVLFCLFFFFFIIICLLFMAFIIL